MQTQLKLMLLIIAASLIVFIGCKKNVPAVATTIEKKETVVAKSSGATQISGVAVYAAPGECAPPPGPAPSYAITMTGDLEGCLYGFIDEFDCSPSGTYREEGREFFVGTYKGEPGTFWTTYKFEGKFEGCAANGAPLGLEIFGRCQHPIVKGSGTGVFKGVTGRLDFKDDIEAGNFPYRGHLRY